MRLGALQLCPVLVIIDITRPAAPRVYQKVTFDGQLNDAEDVIVGTTNASLRRDDDPNQITNERAFELLAERRAKGPAKKPARKTPAKKSAATSSSKKVTARKAAARAKASE